jgi:electron transfer flavoprotein-quinone oxidoreductase
MTDDKFDVIIVGAGVAGSTAAYLLAKQGLEVVLIERGPYPGSKNLSGGVLYGAFWNKSFPATGRKRRSNAASPIMSSPL